MKLNVLALLVTALAAVQAVFVDEAFKVDWLHSQIGAISQANTVVSHDMITVYTDAKVLASLNVSDGSIIWRKYLPYLENGHIVLVNNGFKDKPDQYYAFGGYDSLRQKGIVQSLDPATGALVSEIVYDDKVTYLNSVEDQRHVVVGFESKVTLLNGFTNQEIWTHDLDAQLVEYSVFHEGGICVIYQGPQGTHEFISYNVTTGEHLANRTAFNSTFEMVAFNDLLMVGKIGHKGYLATINRQGTMYIDGFEMGNDNYTVTLHGGEEYTSYVLTDSAGNSRTKRFSTSWLTMIGDVEEPGYRFDMVWIEGAGYKIPEAALAIPVGTDSVLTRFVNGTLSLLDIITLSPRWSRQESLAQAIEGVFMDLPETETSLSEEEILYETESPIWSAYLQRLGRHLNDLPYLSQYLRSYFTADRESSLDRFFGFKKHFVVLTNQGNLVALDTLRGEVAWAMSDIKGHPLGLSVTGSTISVASQEGFVTIVDGITGTIVGSFELQLSSNENIESVTDGLAWTSIGRLISVTEAVHLDKLYVFKQEDSKIQGYVFQNGKLAPSWEFKPAGDIVATAQRHKDDLTASIGAILPDRSVLYKYLYPNTLAVASIADGALTISLVDTVTGRLLHSQIHEEKVISAEGVQLVYGEHWLVYSYYSLEPTASTKIAVWDMFESGTPNERWSDKAEYSSFKNFPSPYVSTQSFLIDTRIKSLAISRTRFGITSRDIIASVGDSKVIALPKRLLDSRRPLEKPTPQEQELGAIQYESYIPVNGQIVLSHSRQVIVDSIVTSPASLESTSLVVGFKGLDIFFTRVTPSQPFDILTSNFEKTKLIITIAALGTVVLVLRARVSRKVVNAKWGVGQL